MVDRKTLDKAVSLIAKGYSQYEYFFSKLESVDWIQPLLEKGFFVEPPADEQHGDSVYWNIWPESRYLQRVANQNPEAVAQVFLAMQETSNPYVHMDLVNAALNMPASAAAKLAEKERLYLDTQEHLGAFTAHEHGKLVVHLAVGGEISEAVSFARSLLDIVPDPRFEDGPLEEEPPDDMAFMSLPRPRVKLDSWYDIVLEEHMPSFVSAAGLDALKLFCDLLEKSIRLSLSDPNDSQPLDHSYIWIPLLDSTNDLRRTEFRGRLAITIRSAIDQILDEELSGLDECLEILDSREWDIFRRMGLYVLAKRFDSSFMQARDRIMDRSLFDDPWLDCEYFELAAKIYPSLSTRDQETLISWIGEGPIRPVYRPDDTHQEREREIKIWKCMRLHALVENLPDEHRETYQALVKEVGETGTRAFRIDRNPTAIWVGPTSPHTIEEIIDFTDDALIKTLRTWIPSGEWASPSPEGFGRAISAAVEKNVLRFSGIAKRFIDLDPTYVRALVNGIERAVGNKQEIDWQPTLNLATWVVEEHGSELDSDGYDRDRDPGWGWTRKNIASLLDSGLNTGPGELPFEYREVAWNILKVLCEDPEPTPEYEEKCGGNNMDSLTLSLNVTRGRAISAALGYALWVKRNLLEAEEHKIRTSRWIDLMPEVRDVLERHLDPEIDPSGAIRSNYGQNFPQLIWLDSDWASSKVNAIFGSPDSRTSLERDAWNAFIGYCHPGTLILSILVSVYETSIEELVRRDEHEPDRFHPESRLAQHLIVYHLWGELERQGQENLLTRFFDVAEDALRAQAIDYAGDCAGEHQEEDDEDALDRLRSLWEKRVEAIEAAPTKANFLKELRAFGSWYVSGAFDEAWALNQLRWELSITGEAEPDHLVVQRLANVDDEYLSTALTCIEAMARGDNKGWVIESWSESPKNLILRCIRSQEDSLVQQAISFVHWLGARGYRNFRHLLETSDEDVADSTPN